MKSRTSASVRFLALADLSANRNDGGYGGVMREIEREVTHAPYDVVLHAGDIAYNLHDENGAVGDAFMADIEPVASRVPYLVSPGNHESYYNFSHFNARFTTPGYSSGPGSRGNLWWSRDVGPVHLVSYNTEAYFDGPVNVTVQKQFEWLQRDLARANDNRARVPWIVALGHRPFYCNVAGHDSTGALQCDGEQEQSRVGPAEQHGQLSVERLFHEFGVDLALFGHVHDYSRFLPVFNHTVRPGSDPTEPYTNPRATVYMTIGGAGNPEMPQPPQSKCTTWDPADNCTEMPRTPWLSCESGYFPKCPNFNYGRVVVHNSTHLHWEQVSVTKPGEAVNGSVTKNASIVSPGVVIDEMWLVQNQHGPFAHEH